MNLATLAERNLAEYGEYERLIFEGKTYSNRELHEASCRLTASLTALGLTPGDKVIVMMQNSPEVLVTYPAVWRAGLIVIPVLFVLEARELAYIIQNSKAKAVVTSPDVYPKVAEAIQIARATWETPNVRVIVTGDARALGGGVLSFEELVAKGSPLSPVAPREKGDLATILYTSGTTGRPKGVMQTHHNLYSNAMNGWNTATTRDRGETGLLVLPLAHTFGLSVLISGYLWGTRSILMRWFDAEKALSLIQRYKVKAMAGVPTMYIYMLLHPRADQYDTSSVKRWVVGAAPMPVERLVEFERKFGGTMYVGYGLSEASPGVAGEREGRLRKPGSAGTPAVGVTVKIVDENAKDLPRGQVGEIIVSGDNISPGYYENPEATAETFRDGWLFTGDLGYLDEDGYLFIVERKKDLIIRGGFNIYPKDVEEVIHQHPAVQEAAVVGVTDLRMGEEVCAYVVKRPGAAVSLEDIVQHCQLNLAKYKTPRYVEIVDELPKTTIGKIQKKELRKLAAAKFAR